MSETGRIFDKSLPIIPDITSKAAGKSELQEFVASPIFYAMGIIVPLMIFPEPISYVSIIVLTLGDGFAGIFGEAFGKRRIPFNKTKNFEGTASGFFFAFMGSLLFVDPLRALIASAVGMFTEVLPLPVNDNLTIPLASGAALIVASAL
jgi:dolichol kinase